MKKLFYPFILILFVSCSKSDTSTSITAISPPVTTNPTPTTPAPVVTTKSYAYAALFTSYQLKYESKSWVDVNALRLKNNQNGFFSASYFDFDNDGDEDILVVPSGDAIELKRYNNDPSITKGDLELYINQGNGQFTLDQTVFSPTNVGLIGPRKTVIGDFDGDKNIDVLALGTGYDPYPDQKESPIFLINKGGKFSTSSNDLMSGYRHGGCAGDIDKDGDIDVLLVGNTSQSNLFLNNGDGTFVANDGIFVDKSNIFFSVLNAELIDIDGDGNLDMILMGSDAASFNLTQPWAKNSGSKIFFGNPKLTSLELKNATIIPTPTYNLKNSEYRTIHDIDVVDLDGDKKNEIVLLRVNDMHDGVYIQILKLNTDKTFTDISEKMIPNNCIRTNVQLGGWLDYFKVGDTDNDGLIEIYSPFRRIDAPKTNQFTGYQWEMDANKVFQFIGSNY
jgi:hypothetical protein